MGDGPTEMSSYRVEQSERQGVAFSHVMPMPSASFSTLFKSSKAAASSWGVEQAVTSVSSSSTSSKLSKTTAPLTTNAQEVGRVDGQSCRPTGQLLNQSQLRQSTDRQQEGCSTNKILSALARRIVVVGVSKDLSDNTVLGRLRQERPGVDVIRLPQDISFAACPFEGVHVEGQLGIGPKALREKTVEAFDALLRKAWGDLPTTTWLEDGALCEKAKPDLIRLLEARRVAGARHLLALRRCDFNILSLFRWATNAAVRVVQGDWLAFAFHGDNTTSFEPAQDTAFSVAGLVLWMALQLSSECSTAEQAANHAQTGEITPEVGKRVNRNHHTNAHSVSSADYQLREFR